MNSIAEKYIRQEALAKIPITAETLADWDIYDIQMFYRTYIDYLLEIKNSKN